MPRVVAALAIFLTAGLAAFDSLSERANSTTAPTTPTAESPSRPRRRASTTPTDASAAAPRAETVAALALTPGLDASTVVVGDAQRRARPLRLETVRRDPLGRPIRATRLETGGDSVAIHHEDGVVERWLGDERSREQRWELRSRPTGDAFSVTVKASGLRHDRVDAAGHHFVDPANGAGLVYSHATWIDAAGKATAIPVAYARGELRMRVPPEVVARSSYPAVLDPTISPEFLLDETIEYRPAQNDQSVHGLACTNDTCLAVYSTSTSQAVSFRVARFTPSGSMIDPIGGRVPALEGAMTIVGVAALDGAFLVLSVAGTSLSVTRVPAAGPVDGGVSSVVATVGYGSTPRMASDGSHVLVVRDVYDATEDAMRLVGFRIDGSGARVDAADLAIPTVGFEFSNYQVVAGSTGYLVTFAETSGYANLQADIGYVRLATDGSALDALPRRLFQNPYTITAYMRGVGGDGIYLLVLPWAPTGGDTVLGGIRVDAATGAVLDATPFLIVNQGSIVTGVLTPQLVFDGTQFVISAYVASSSNDVRRYRLHRFNRNGARISPPSGSSTTEFPAEPGPATNLALALAGDSLVGAYTGYRTPFSSWSKTEVYVSSIPNAGYVTPSVDHLLSARSTQQQDARLAWNGDRHLAVYSDDLRNGSSARLLTADGTTIGAPFALGESLTALAGRPGGFLTVSGTSNTVRLLDANGQPTGSTHDLGNDNAGYASAAATGPQGNLIVFSGNTGSSSRPWARATDLDGTPRGLEMLPLLPAGSVSGGTSLDVATFGDQFVVAFDQPLTWVTRRFGVVFVDPATGLPTTRDEATDEFHFGTTPRIACLPSRCLLVYRRTIDGALHGRFVGSSGFLGLPFALETATPQQTVGEDLEVTTDGETYVVGWTRRLASSGRLELVALRVGALGGVADLGGFVVDERPDGPFTTFEMQLGGLTAPTADTAVVVYHARTRTTQHDSLRVRGRVIGLDDSDGAICRIDAQCASGSCVDGVCCESACGGGVTSDCQACSVARGGAVDGVCGTVSAGTTCAAASNACAHAAVCDGSGTSCPAPAPFDVAVECDDTNECTLDACAAATGCTHTPLTTPMCIPTPDAGTTVDAGSEPTDGGGTNSDAGETNEDGGPIVEPDAGETPTDGGASGCSCRVANDAKPSALGLIGIAAIAALTLRRSRLRRSTARESREAHSGSGTQ